MRGATSEHARRPVSEEQRSSRPKMSLPQGAGGTPSGDYPQVDTAKRFPLRFWPSVSQRPFIRHLRRHWAATASHVRLRSAAAPRSALLVSLQNSASQLYGYLWDTTLGTKSFPAKKINSELSDAIAC